MEISQVINTISNINSENEGVKSSKQKNNETKKFSLEVKKVREKDNFQNKNVTTDNKADSSENLVIEDEEIEVSKESIDAILELLAALLKRSGDITESLSTEAISKNEGSVEPLLELLGVNTEGLEEKLKDGNLGKEIFDLLDNEALLDTLLINLNISKESQQGQDVILKVENIKNIIENNNLDVCEDAILKELINSNLRSTTANEEIESDVNKYKQEVVEVTPKNLSSEKDNTNNNLLSREEALLEKLTKFETGEEKVTRVNNFISILNNNIENINTGTIGEPVTVTKSNVNSDVIKALTYMEQNGIKDLTVKIYPRELGEVTISVVMEHGTLKAMVKASTREAVDMLAAGLGEINDKLSSQNIKIESVNVSLYEQDTTYFKDNQRSFNENNKNSNDDGINVQGDIEIEEESSIVNATSGVINILI